MQLEARDFAARFREMHSLRLRPNLPPLELEQAPATLDDGAADPLGTGSTVWRGGDALAPAPMVRASRQPGGAERERIRTATWPVVHFESMGYGSARSR